MTATTVPSITADQVTEHRSRTTERIAEARRACYLAVADAATPSAGQALVAHAAQLSHLLLDDWQLGIVADLVEHETKHGPDCTSELCVMDDDELVDMANRWELQWPALCDWLHGLVAEDDTAEPCPSCDYPDRATRPAQAAAVHDRLAAQLRATNP